MMKVKNYMEILVTNAMLGILNKRDVCKCERCCSDIMAIALNILPTKYIATEWGEVYSKVDALSVQSEVDVIKAILEAIEKVKVNPRH